jgi:hypothetical protein
MFKKIILHRKTFPDGGSQGGELGTENSLVDYFPGERPAKEGRTGYGSREGCLYAIPTKSLHYRIPAWLGLGIITRKRFSLQRESL